MWTVPSALGFGLFGDSDHAFAGVVAVEETDEGGGGVFEAVDDVFFDF